jgi:hypothetical protein
MSLHKFADMVASKGRGEDSLLIHMTPDEVNRLQEFAKANGRSLTINPETGLPEAGMLSDLFKAVAPIALGAFLGPGAFGIAGLGLSAGTAGLVTGGLTTLATGSLSRGLMAGLGAYGGAGLAEGLMGAGAGAAQQSAMGSLSADQIAAEMANTELTKQGVLNQAAADATKSAMANTGQAVSSGFNAVTSTPSAMGAFAKQNLGNIAAAAAPIMAGAMVPTTTKMPVDTNPAYIRQKLYDPYTQTYKSLAPVKASEFGSRNFSDAYTNPQTGQMATLDQRQPTPMAGGGIVALARGGDVVRMAGGTPPALLSDEALYQKTGSWEAAAAARDAQNNALNAYNWNQAQQAQNPALIQQAQANAVSTQNALTAAKDYVTSAATPTTTTDQFISGANTAGIGLTQPLQTALANSGLSAAAQYALTHANIGPDVNKEETYGGLKGLSSNINYISSGMQDLISQGKLTGQNAREQALTEMNKYGINEADIMRATGKTLKELFPDTVAKKVVDTFPDTGTGTGGTGTGGTGTGITTATPDPFTSVIPGGFYGNATNPGDITRNPDGTATVHPNIPYRPYGGFSGMEEVRNAYTKGGGSLGYTAPIPKDPEAAFNTLTDDSLDAYKFLMGKGKNLAQTNAARSRPLMQPYFTESNRYKPKFLSYGKDGEITSSTTSGKPADVKAADLTKAKTIEIVDSSGYDTQTYTAVLQDDGTYLAGNGKRYDVTGKQIAAGGGMMGYAVGGGLGSLGSYSDGGRLLKGPGDGVSDSIPATIGAKQQPARLADGEFVIPARIVSELGNGSTEAGAKKLYAMMDRVQRARGKTTGKNKVAANSRADKYLPA